jgi:hypothetical protein
MAGVLIRFMHSTLLKYLFAVGMNIEQRLLIYLLHDHISDVHIIIPYNSGHQTIFAACCTSSVINGKSYIAYLVYIIPKMTSYDFTSCLS